MGLKEDVGDILSSDEGAATKSTVDLTVEQRDMFDQAMEKVRGEVGVDDLSEGRCLELICFDFVQSFMVPVPEKETDAVG